MVVAVRARAVAAAFWSHERRSSWSGVDVGMALRAVGVVVCGGVGWKGKWREREGREREGEWVFGCLYRSDRSPRGLLRPLAKHTNTSTMQSTPIFGGQGVRRVAFGCKLHSKVQPRVLAYLNCWHLWGGHEALYDDQEHQEEQTRLLY